LITVGDFALQDDVAGAGYGFFENGVGFGDDAVAGEVNVKDDELRAEQVKLVNKVGVVVTVEREREAVGGLLVNGNDDDVAVVDGVWSAELEVEVVKFIFLCAKEIK
jgi:hypothetical protein